MSESNVDIARRGWEAAQRGDFDAIAALLDADVKWHGGDPAAGCQNRAEALTFIQRAFARVGAIELIDVVGKGDRVAVIMRPPGSAPVANLSTFRDGKVVEMVHYPNPADALAAVGK
jgi:ketosteroid isomerase-like protein